MRCLEQILEAATYKTAAVQTQQLSISQTIHQKSSKVYSDVQEKREQTLATIGNGL